MMNSDLFFRTEDIRVDEVLKYLVETPIDRNIINSLKGRTPMILRGSRGVGKSFLLRSAEAELANSFNTERILPVYVTFARATLITDPTPERFLAWMTSKICNRIVRTANSMGITLPRGSSIDSIRGSGENSTNYTSKMEEIEAAFEDAWKNAHIKTDVKAVPGPEVLKDAAEDLCEHAHLKRIALFIDEAAHVFIPEQQRQFFTLMRDLRSPYITVNAAVYPGATSFGPSFQPDHDATILSVDRTVTDKQYAESMRSIIYKQDVKLRDPINRHGEVFDTLAYAATGNPRILLKTLSKSTPFNKRNAQETIREYYREEIWAEHSSLAERYPGHRELIDWGRQFIEGSVLPELYSRNREHKKRETSAHIWIHRDAPQAVREALNLLCYSGILQEGTPGIRATRSQVGTRYMVNLGCQFALDAEPISFGHRVRSSLSIKRMVEYGANHLQFRPLQSFSVGRNTNKNQALQARLDSPCDLLDISEFLRSKLRELGFKTIGDVLASDEKEFTKAKWVGAVRSRHMRNAAVAAVLEYLSG